tara:strand:+ start:521 stop:673 length:153 start_codon:yes stop_codon:yes gene_type:complete
MKIDTEVIKHIMYGVDPTAKEDKEFVETINMWVHLMEQEQKKRNKKKLPK